MMSSWEQDTRQELLNRLEELNWDLSWIQRETLLHRVDLRSKFARRASGDELTRVSTIQLLCVGAEYAPAAVSVRLNLPAEPSPAPHSQKHTKFIQNPTFESYSLHIDENQIVSSIFEDPERVYVDDGIQIGSLAASSILSYLRTWEFQIPNQFKSVAQHVRRSCRMVVTNFVELRARDYSSLFQAPEETAYLSSLCLDVTKSASSLINDLRPLMGRDAIRFVVHIWRFFAISTLVETRIIPEAEATSFANALVSPPVTEDVPRAAYEPQAIAEPGSGTTEQEISLSTYENVVKAAADVRAQRQFAPVVSNLIAGQDKDNIRPKSDLDIMAEQRDYKRRRASYRAKRTHITKRTPAQTARELIKIMFAEFLPAPPATPLPSAISASNSDRSDKPGDRDRDRDRHRYDDRNRESDWDRDRHDDRRSSTYEREWDRDRERGPDRDRDRARDRDRDRDRERDKDRDRPRTGERDRDRPRDRDGDANRNRDHDRSRDQERDRERDRDRNSRRYDDDRRRRD